MAGLKNAITSILTKLQDVTELQFIRVWNNQLAQDEQGQIYSFPKPAAFVEARTPNPFLPLGGGFSQSDITFVIHLVHEQYDAGDGTFEQNLDVFDLKAKIVTLLTNWKPDMCSGLMKVAEVQHYEHTNLYHYQIEFLTGLIDDAGSDDNKGLNITKEPPTDLTIEVTWQGA